MKKILSICFLWAFSFALWGQSNGGYGGDFNPTNPGNPQEPSVTVKYDFKVTAGKGGNVSHYPSEAKFTKDTQIQLNANPNAGYRFKCWMEDNKVISNSEWHYYTMPAKDVEIKAVFAFEPEVPANPDVIPLTYNVTVQTSPSNTGNAYSEREKVNVGEYTYVYAYSYNGYQFKGWQLDGKIVSTDSHYYFEMPSRNMHFTALFEFNPDVPGNPNSNPNNEPTYLLKYTIDGQVCYTEQLPAGATITAIAEPIKKGHTFSGWSNMPSLMPANDLVVSGTFAANVHHVTYKFDGAVVHEEDVAYGTTLTPPTTFNKEGYTLVWESLPTTMPDNDVETNGSYSINSYKLTYIVDGNVYKTVDVVYQSAITPLENPTKEGHTFSGWSEMPETMPAKEVIVTGSFSINSYKVTYIVDGKEYKTASVTYGSKPATITTPLKEGHTFSGWEGLPETMPANNVTVTGSFSINTYKLIYKVDGIAYKTESVVYGAAVTAIEHPTMEGYTFSGWTGVPETMPAENVTVTGSFSVNSYKVTYIVDGKEYKTVTYEYGASITNQAAPTKKGYTFSGWDGIYEIMPAKDITVTGFFTVNQYTVTYIIDGETFAVESVNYGAKIASPDVPVKAGYTFSWLNEIPTVMPARNIVINGVYTDVEYFVFNEKDGLMATTSVNSEGTEQFEYTSPVLKFEEPSNTIYFTFLKGYSSWGNVHDHNGYPFVALAELNILDAQGNEIVLTAENFSTNAQEEIEGSISNICDGDRTTFFHSSWTIGVAEHHQIVVTLPGGMNLNEFKFKYITRYTNHNVPASICVDTKSHKIQHTLSGKCGDNLTWTLQGSELKIEGTGPMDSYSSWGEVPWRGYATFVKDSIRKVTISDGVTSIGNYAFYDCYNLESVSVPESVVTVGRDAFSYTQWYYNQPDGVIYIGKTLYAYKGEMPMNTSIEVKNGTKHINSYAFNGYENLVSVTIPESVTSIEEYTFGYCRNLATVVIPETVTSIASNAFEGTAWYDNQPDGVIYIGSVLYKYKGNMPENTSIQVKDGTVRINPFAFYYCNNLKSITIPEGVKEIGYNAFEGCYGLNSVAIPNSTELIMNSAFSSCYNLRTVSLGNGVKELGWHLFYNCNNLHSVVIPKSVSTIGGEVFAYANNLKYVYSEPLNPPTLASDCRVDSLTILYVPKGSLLAYENSDWRRYFSSIVELESEELASGTCGDNLTWKLTINGELIIEGTGAMHDYTEEYNEEGWLLNTPWYNVHTEINKVTIKEGVTSVGNYAFYNCYNLTNVDISQSVDSIGVFAFANCNNLQQVVLAEGLTVIEDYAFSWCYALNDITLPHSLTTMGSYAFQNCNSLVSIVIPEHVERIGSDVFAWCGGITSVTVSADNDTYDSRNGCNAIIETKSNTLFLGCVATQIPADVTKIGDYAFSGCYALQTIDIPYGVTVIGYNAFSNCGIESIIIPESVTNIGEYAFNGCNSLSSIALPESVETIGGYAFAWCYNLSSVSLPEGLTTIMYGAFYDCDRLKSIILPETVTTIGDNAFSWCDSLTTITIPRNVEYMGGYAFDGCEALDTIYCYAPEPPYCYELGATTHDAILYVTNDKLVSLYQSSDGWSSIADIRPMNLYNLTVFVDDVKYSETFIEGGATFKLPEISAKEENTFNWYTCQYVPVKITEDMLYTNAPCTNTNYGDEFVGWHVLLDGDNSTFFHSEYNNVDSSDGLDHYIRVDLGRGNEISRFSLSYMTRPSRAYAASPTTIVVEGSNSADGDYTVIATLTDLPTTDATTYQSDILTNGKAYRYIRYRVTATGTGELAYGHPFFAIDELAMTRCDLEPLDNVLHTMPREDLIIAGVYTPNKYLLTFKIGDEVIASDLVGYGTTIVAPDTPVKEGYTFSGWIGVPEIMPANDVVVTGYFTMNIYSVTYMVDGEVYYTDSLAYGSAIVAPDTPVKEGHSFNGWEGIHTTMPAYDIVVNAMFSANYYWVTFMADGMVWCADYLMYGSVINIPEAPIKEGYTFNGWGEVSGTVPAYDVTYEACYTANTYNVYYYLGDMLVYMVEVAYGEMMPDAPSLDGYPFIEWMGEMYDSMPAHDVVYIANVGGGIEQSATDSSQMVIYDLSGRKLSVSDLRELTRGVYIINGKRVLVP